jgi:hypothetical protein
MPTKSVLVEVRVPEGVSVDAKESARSQAREAAVLDLWRRGELSTRLAAAELDLEYYDFLDLLAEKGIPVSEGDLDLGTLEAARRKLAEGRP